MSLYKLTSEHATWVNLEASLETLQWQQALLQRRAAQVAADLAVVTNVIVERTLTDLEVSASINRGEH